MKKIYLILVGLLLSPSILYAAELGNLGIIVPKFTKLIQDLIPVAFGFALLTFFWGLARYMYNSGSEEAKAEGRRIMVGGAMALFIMSSIWGIVTFIASDLGLDQTKKSMGVPTIGK